MSLCHELLGDDFVGLHLGTGGREVNIGCQGRRILLATGTGNDTTRFQHSHSLQLRAQHVGHGEVVEALVFHRCAILVLEDEHAGGLVEDVLRGHDVLFGQRQQGLFGGLRQLFFQSHTAHGRANLALHAVAFQLTLVLGFLLGQRLLQLAVHLLGRGEFAFQFIEVFLQFLVARTAGNLGLQALNLGGEAFVGGLVTCALVGRTLQGTDDASHILAGLLALVALDCTFRRNHGVHLPQGLPETLIERCFLVALRQTHQSGLLLVGQARQAFLCIKQI